MTGSRRNIRVKAMAVFRRGGKILANAVHEPDGRLIGYRIPGGHVEFHELSQDTVVREIMEETGLAVSETRLLGIRENLFTYGGKPRHEVIFIYETVFADPSVYDRDVIKANENQRPFDLVWVDPQDMPRGLPLFPAGLSALL